MIQLYFPLLLKDQSVEVDLDGGEDEKEDEDGNGDGGVEEADVNWKEHPDVDGGWAWVVLFSCFFIFIITSGMLLFMYVSTPSAQ